MEVNGLEPHGKGRDIQPVGFLNGVFAQLEAHGASSFNLYAVSIGKTNKCVSYGLEQGEIGAVARHAICAAGVDA